MIESFGYFRRFSEREAMLRGIAHSTSTIRQNANHSLVPRLHVHASIGLMRSMEQSRRAMQPAFDHCQYIAKPDSDAIVKSKAKRHDHRGTHTRSFTNSIELAPNTIQPCSLIGMRTMAPRTIPSHVPPMQVHHSLLERIEEFKEGQTTRREN
jgi:hypothetical protein